MGKKCLKCGYERKKEDIAPEYECPNCSVIYAKVAKAQKKTTSQKNNSNKFITYESKHVNHFCESHLKSGEKILTWADGYIGEMMGSGDNKQHNGVLIVTGERVAFYRKGIFGEVLETIPLKKITSIERKTLMGHRTIQIHTSHDDLKFKTFDQKKETKLLNAIESGRESKDRDTNTSNAANTQQDDPMAALKKLGELKTMGIITEEEFQEKKAVLLERL